MNTVKRLVRTNVEATPKNVDMFKSVFGQLSDGIWENSNGMDGYWATADVGIIYNTIYIVIDTEAYTEEKVYGYRGYHWRLRKNRWHDMTDVQVVKYFLNKIRYIAKLEIKDDDHWKKNPTWDANCDKVCCYLDRRNGVTFGDAYTLVEEMKKTVKKMEAHK